MNSEMLVTHEAIHRFPSLTQVVGGSWIRKNPQWFEARDRPRPIWYGQVDTDLTALRAKVPLAKLTSCYRSMLRSSLHDRDALFAALYEIHGAALLATVGQHVDLHVPREPWQRTNFDVRVETNGVVINGDCKARRDDFPIKPQFRDPAFGYSASRAVLDPHEAAALGIPSDEGIPGSPHVRTPESTVVRTLLEDALTQLPETGVNVVLFGQIAGDREHLERALSRGAPVADFITSKMTNQFVGIDWRSVGSTVFGDAKFAGLSAVLWMRICEVFGPMQYAYSLYTNPHAMTPMPSPISDELQAEFARRGNLATSPEPQH